MVIGGWNTTQWGKYLISFAGEQHILVSTIYIARGHQHYKTRLKKTYSLIVGSGNTTQTMFKCKWKPQRQIEKNTRHKILNDFLKNIRP